MPIYKANHRVYYSTRAETLKTFRDEEKKPCSCRYEIWARNENKITCLNCVRRSDLKEELERKGFWTSNKNLKYWKICCQGQYKQLKIAPVYPASC